MTISEYLRKEQKCPFCGEDVSNVSTTEMPVDPYKSYMHCDACDRLAYLNEQIKPEWIKNNPKENSATDPNHYKIHNMECWDEMEVVFGTNAVIQFCKLNAWKYRYRASEKNGEEDLKKADVYLKKAKELQEKDDWIRAIY